MTYVAAEARRELLEDVADAIEAIGSALAALGIAYDQLDDRTADTLEEQLFHPVQAAYGRAKRTYAGFAERFGLPVKTFAAAPPAGAPHGVKAALDQAVAAVDRADHVLVTLQDSMRPVEVGDAELRAGLAEVRELLGVVRGRARELVRTLGR